ncbi:branched-chain amino acid ABC transporter permease [Candidatus Peregrinibacteria bacterium]|nr:MAG: branched-chain amino acid ABC transporter permease [Candidatus Peregrinibacteria bacterium]
MQILLNGIIVGGIYALIALGFNLIFSSTRFFHVLYGVLALLGAYFTYTFMEYGWNFFAAIPVAALLASLLGVASWQFLYKPLVDRKASSLVLMVTSFGALIVVQNLIALIWKNNTKSISITDTIKPAYEFLGLNITFNQLVILAVSIVLMVLLELFLKKTKYGLAIRAIGDNAELTTVLGLHTNRITLLVFFIGTFLSAVSASLIALEIGARPTHGLHYFFLKAVIASIIGGIGSMRGALIGGLLLGVVENIGIYYLGGSWQEVVAFSLLTLFLLFKPQGLVNQMQLAK